MRVAPSLHCQTADVNRRVYRNFAWRPQGPGKSSGYRLGFVVRRGVSPPTSQSASPGRRFNGGRRRWRGVVRERSGRGRTGPLPDHEAVGAGEGRGDEATQYGPVALEVAVTILQPAHHHLREVAQPQVEVRPGGSPGGSSLLAMGGVEVGIKEVSSEHPRRSRSDHSAAQVRAVGIDHVPGQGGRGDRGRRRRGAPR